MQVIDRKFYSKYHNDTDFSSDLTDFATNLVGSVMEEKKVITTVNIDVNMKFGVSDYNTIEFNTSTSTITVSRGGLITKGFRVGDEIFVQTTNGTPNNAANVKIIALTNNIITYSFISGTAISSATATEFEIRLLSDLTSLIFDYNVIENSDTTNYATSLDGVTDQSFYGAGINHTTSAYINMTPLAASGFKI